MSIDMQATGWELKLYEFAREWRDHGLESSLDVTMTAYVRSRCADERMEQPTDEQLETIRQRMTQRI